MWCKKTSRADDLMLSLSAGTHSAAKACMLLDEHRKSVRCEADPDMLNDTDKDPVLTCVYLVLSLKLDMSESGEAKTADEVFADQVGGYLASKKSFCGRFRLDWKLCELCLTKCFSFYQVLAVRNVPAHPFEHVVAGVKRKILLQTLRSSLES